MNGVETAGESLWTKAKSAFSGIKSLFESGSESKVNPLDFAGNGSSKNGKTAAQAAKAQGDISRPPNGNGPAGIPAGGVPANPEPVGSVSQPPTGGAGKTHKHDTKAGTADTAAKAAQAAGA
ncbi:hypothetical protein FRB99_002557 [Tulasnella sp. 403]|nr:hypothetical protein FRB99_002557 [Tulasnella sp. 403]